MANAKLQTESQFINEDEDDDGDAGQSDSIYVSGPVRKKFKKVNYVRRFEEKVFLFVQTIKDCSQR